MVAASEWTLAVSGGTEINENSEGVARNSRELVAAWKDSFEHGQDPTIRPRYYGRMTPASAIVRPPSPPAPTGWVSRLRTYHALFNDLIGLVGGRFESLGDISSVRLKIEQK